MKLISNRAFVLAVVFLMVPRAFAEEPDSGHITEADKRIFKDFQDRRKMKALQTSAVMNLRQIGMALFEFETEYGSFPDEKTAVSVKESAGAKADLKAKTANDCFYQLIASGILATDRIFSLEPPKQGEEKPKAPAQLTKCVFSYLTGLNASGNPSRPVVVAPLVNGEKTFDPAVLGGKAVVLRVDCSVQSFPIDKGGHVMIDGKNIFDPAQPFWNGNVPPVVWPAE